MEDHNIKSKLIKTIIFYNKYVNGKQFSDNKLQDVLSDCLTRHTNEWDKYEKKPIKLIDCIKYFYKSNSCQKRFEKIKDMLILPTINETNKLLLMKSIFFEERFELSN